VAERSIINGIPTIQTVIRAAFTIPTDLTAGSYYYYCVVSATDVASVTSEVVTVDVNPVRVTGVTVAPKTASIVAGGTLPLTATVTPANASNKSIVWNSSNPDVATVIAGIVMGINAGTATITATPADGSNESDTCTVTVTSSGDDLVRVDSVTVTPKNASTVVDGTLSLTATVLPGNANNKNVVWRSSNETVASVNSSGLVKGIKQGTATITVETIDGYLQCNGQQQQYNST